MARVVIYGMSIRTDRTDRKSDIRSVKNFLRSVNCISLVVDTVCRSKEITRIAKLVYLRGVVGLLQDVFGKALPRAQFSC